MVVKSESEQVGEFILKSGKRAIKKGLKPQVRCVHSTDVLGWKSFGNFTMVSLARGTNIFMGVSKRNPEDSNNPVAGIAVACRRLVEGSCYPEK